MKIKIRTYWKREDMVMILDNDKRIDEKIKGAMQPENAREDTDR